jgi:purine nucleoside permease
MGDNMAAMTFWHGRLLNDWANKYVDYWTDGKGQFVSSAMEDTGTAQSLWYLDQAGRADYQRLMVLRTASNFSMPVLPGETSAQSLLGDGEGFTGLRLSLEVAYEVGSTVVAELLANWNTYETDTPK